VNIVAQIWLFYNTCRKWNS